MNSTDDKPVEKTFVEWAKNPISKKAEKLLVLINKFNKATDLESKYSLTYRIVKLYPQLSVGEATTAAKSLGYTLSVMNDSITSLSTFNEAYRSLKKWKVLRPNSSVNMFFNNINTNKTQKTNR
jgi:hypothetical protein